MDKHNFLENLIVSPRISTLYKPISNLQFRANWSTGFRAPQAFDTDLHIAFAGEVCQGLVCQKILEKNDLIA